MASDNDLRTRMLADVERVAPTLAEHAAASANLGRLDDTSIDAIRATRLLDMVNPRELGGEEADPRIQLDVLEALARVDASAAWCIGILATTAAMAGAFLPKATARRIFESGTARVAGMVAPRAKGEAATGGFRLSGRWSFGSGIHHADWVVAGFSLPGEPPSLRLAVVPKAAVQVHDNWQVAGLEASGSCDYSMADVVVPEDMTFPLPELLAGHAVTGGAALRLGVPALVVPFHMAIPLGIAQRAVDEITGQASRKSSGLPPTPLPTHPEFQLALGKAVMELKAARSLAQSVVAEFWQHAEAGRALSPLEHAEARAVATYVTDVARRVTGAAFQAGGGGALFDTNPLQRCMRDVLAAGQHFVVSESSYCALGQGILGLPDVNPMQ